MPTTVSIAIPDVPVHITQRGNNRRYVFFVYDDRRVVLSIFREYSESYGLEVLGRPKKKSNRQKEKDRLTAPYFRKNGFLLKQKDTFRCVVNVNEWIWIMV